MPPKRVMELIHRRNQLSKSWLRDDGATDTEIYLAPVHYKDASGQWQGIIAGIARSVSGEFEYVIDRADYLARFARRAAGFFLFAKDGSQIVWRFKDARLLSVGQISENKALYPSAFSSADLRYEALPEGLKEEIVLHSSNAPLSYTIIINTKNCRPVIKPMGRIEWENNQGDKIFSMRPIIAVDSAGETLNIIGQLINIDENTWEYQFTVDSVWLNDASRQWPVVIDPTTTTFQPTSADAYVYSTSSGGGTGDFMSVGLYNYERRSLIKWDLSSLVGATVSAAEIQLYGYNKQGTCDFRGFNITASWDEATVKADTQPSHGSQITTSFTQYYSGQWDRWVLDPAAVQNWIDNVNYGIKIIAFTDSNSATDYRTREYTALPGNRPKLIITHNTAPSAPTNLDPGGTAGSPEAISTTTPTLTWTHSDPDGDAQASFQVQIYRTSDNALIHDSNEVASGTSSYSVPGGTLSTGVGYYWRVRTKDSAGAWGSYSGNAYIIINQAPQQPTNLSPASNEVFDATADKEFSWTFNDPDSGDTQSAYQLIIIRVSDGVTVHDTGKTASSTSAYTLPASTLTNGVDYQWKAKTWDSVDAEGPYSDLASFTTGQPPSVSIADPSDGGTYSSGTLIVTWSYSDPDSNPQSKYRAKLWSSGKTILLEDGGEVVGTDTEHTFAYAMADGTGYVVEVQVWDDTDQSDTDEHDFTADFAPAPTPTIALSEQSGFIRVTITNPAPGAGEEATDHNDVYRRIQGASSWTRIATSVAANGTYDDYAVASGVTYEYKVVAVTANGGTGESATSAESITFLGVWLHDPTDAADTVHQFQHDGRGRGANWQAEAQLMQFAGRTKPVAEFGEVQTKNPQVTLMLIKNSGDIEELEALVELKTTLCYRDSYSRKIFGVITGLTITDEHWGQQAQFTVAETDYDEEV